MFLFFLVRRNFVNSSVNRQYSNHPIMLSLSHKSQHRHAPKKHGAAWISHVWLSWKDNGGNLCDWVLDGNLHSILCRHW